MSEYTSRRIISITDEMVEAARDGLLYGEMKHAIAAAIAAAPTVDGWAWCDHNDAPIGEDEEGVWHHAESCPGPHGPLLVAYRSTP